MRPGLVTESIISPMVFLRFASLIIQLHHSFIICIISYVLSSFTVLASTFLFKGESSGIVIPSMEKNACFQWIPSRKKRWRLLQSANLSMGGLQDCVARLWMYGQSANCLMDRITSLAQRRQCGMVSLFPYLCNVLCVSATFLATAKMISSRF